MAHMKECSTLQAMLSLAESLEQGNGNAGVQASDASATARVKVRTQQASCYPYRNLQDVCLHSPTTS